MFRRASTIIATEEAAVPDDPFFGRTTRRALISLGSNLGDRRGYLRAARDRIRERFRILQQTTELDNPAVILMDQPDFLNQIIEIEADVSPAELLTCLKQIEADLGRRPRERYGPREIDLDILEFEGVAVHTPDLTLPHPGLRDRAYLHLLLKELNHTATPASVKEEAP